MRLRDVECNNCLNYAVVTMQSLYGDAGWQTLCVECAYRLAEWSEKRLEEALEPVKVIDTSRGASK